MRSWFLTICTLVVTVIAFTGISVTALVAKPRVALVLSGGGSRGLSQIGALRVLERNGIVPDIIVGSSIGAVVGGMYAAGYTADELDSIFMHVDWDEITSFGDETRRETMFYDQKQSSDRNLLTLRFRNFSFIPPQAIGGSARFSGLLQELLWNSPYNTTVNFDSLYIPFRAVATDLATGSSIVLDSGNLATALRASATFPLRYAPVRLNGSILVDGGLIANIPVEAAKAAGADIIIVINTVSEYLSSEDLYTPLNIADQALMAAMKQRDTVWLKSADMVIEPRLGKRSGFDFSNPEELIAAGEKAAQTIVDSLKQLMSKSTVPGSLPESLQESLQGSLSIGNLEVVGLSPDRAQTIVDVAKRHAAKVYKDTSRLTKAQVSRSILHALRSEVGVLARITKLNIIDRTGHMVCTVDRSVVCDISVDASYDHALSDVLREFTFAKGDTLTRDELMHTCDNLRASDLFDEIDVLLYPMADSGHCVRVQAYDRGNQSLRLGARVDNERFTQGSLEFSHHNIFSSGMRLAAKVSGSQRIGEAALIADIPRIASTLWAATAKIYGSFRNVWIYTNNPEAPARFPDRSRTGEFSEDRIGMRLSFGRQLERNGVLLGEFRYEFQRYRQLLAFEVPIFEPIATVRGVGRWDDRDRVDFPNRGRLVDVSLESSLLGFSNGLSFTKLQAKVATHYNLSGVVVSPALQIGAADRTLPSPELFSLGGQDMFYGMREDEERGRQVLVGNLEFRTKLPFKILFDSYISARYDIGAMWGQPENIRISDMRHGVGAAIGIDTPVGPAMFSVGRRFYFLKSPPAVAWGPFLAYFSIGVRL